MESANSRISMSLAVAAAHDYPNDGEGRLAALRVEHRANQLAAETVAAARHFGAVVWVSEGNGRGHVHDQAIASGLDFGIWRFGDTPNGLTPIG